MIDNLSDLQYAKHCFFLGYSHNLLFEQEEDAVRYALMLQDDPKYENPMVVIEVDDELAIKTCKVHNYKYSVITSNDIVIPPKI